MACGRAGVPSMSLAASAFRGQKTEVSFGTVFAFKETGTGFSIARWAMLLNGTWSKATWRRS